MRSDRGSTSIVNERTQNSDTDADCVALEFVEDIDDVAVGVTDRESVGDTVSDEDWLAVSVAEVVSVCDAVDDADGDSDNEPDGELESEFDSDDVAEHSSQTSRPHSDASAPGHVSFHRNGPRLTADRAPRSTTRPTSPLLVMFETIKR